MPASGEKPVRRNELKEAANFAKGVMDSHDVKGAVHFNLRAYSRLMGYAWAAFFGAAGFAFLIKGAMGPQKAAAPQAES